MSNRFVSAASVATLSTALALAGRASSSENIAAAYVSPNQYADYSCDQIREEQARVGTRRPSSVNRVNPARRPAFPPRGAQRGPWRLSTTG
ncbi:hypothetical protein F1188_18005 [Roseospira marina]|uniref:Uncharacterized protein n=1 Tax=Roseospira marina TaxID=140057 RepID=A0A5M6I6W5_9PROT|nr:hypothetical protein [Roseospira marina]KAA5603994.1 hypothetical protein F1188_18005 [Roseospira marina]MBB4315907.1 hypothetical protein [Roseospira marina]MBB5089047.1 hypothetical protein [Roseospira marina]